MFVIETPSPAAALAFSPDSYWLALLTRDGELRRVDPSGSGESVKVADGWNALAFAPNGTLYASGSDAVYEVPPDGAPAPLPGIAGRNGAYPLALACVSDRLLAVGTGRRDRPQPGSLFLYDLSRRVALRPDHGAPEGVRGVAVHRPSKTVVWGIAGRRASTWDVTRADVMAWPVSHPAEAVDISPNAETLAVAQAWGAALIDRIKRRPPIVLKGHTGAVSAVAFAPDGRGVWTASWDGSARLWDAVTGAELRRLELGVGRLRALAVAPDGTRAAAAGDSGKTAVWDAE